MHNVKIPPDNDYVIFTNTKIPKSMFKLYSRSVCIFTFLRI